MFFLGILFLVFFWSVGILLIFVLFVVLCWGELNFFEGEFDIFIGVFFWVFFIIFIFKFKLEGGFFVIFDISLLDGVFIFLVVFRFFLLLFFLDFLIIVFLLFFVVSFWMFLVITFSDFDFWVFFWLVNFCFWYFRLFFNFLFLDIGDRFLVLGDLDEFWFLLGIF